MRRILDIEIPEKQDLGRWAARARLHSSRIEDSARLIQALSWVELLTDRLVGALQRIAYLEKQQRDTKRNMKKNT